MLFLLDIEPFRRSVHKYHMIVMKGFLFDIWSNGLKTCTFSLTHATLFCMVLVNMYTIIAMYFVCSVLICQVSYTGVYFYNRR